MCQDNDLQTVKARSYLNVILNRLREIGSKLPSKYDDADVSELEPNPIEQALEESKRRGRTNIGIAAS